MGTGDFGWYEEGDERLDEGIASVVFCSFSNCRTPFSSALWAWQVLNLRAAIDLSKGSSPNENRNPGEDRRSIGSIIWRAGDRSEERVAGISNRDCERLREIQVRLGLERIVREREGRSFEYLRRAASTYLGED